MKHQLVQHSSKMCLVLLQYIPNSILILTNISSSKSLSWTCNFSQQGPLKKPVPLAGETTKNVSVAKSNLLTFDVHKSRVCTRENAYILDILYVQTYKINILSIRRLCRVADDGNSNQIYGNNITREQDNITREHDTRTYLFAILSSLLDVMFDVDLCLLSC